MDDKTIMTTILSNFKGACDLMMHGSIESTTPNVRSTFKTVLNDTLDVQSQIYSKMNEKGWYQPCRASSSRKSTRQGRSFRRRCKKQRAVPVFGAAFSFCAVQFS